MHTLRQASMPLDSTSSSMYSAVLRDNKRRTRWNNSEQRIDHKLLDLFWGVAECLLSFKSSNRIQTKSSLTRVVRSKIVEASWGIHQSSLVYWTINCEGCEGLGPKPVQIGWCSELGSKEWHCQNLPFATLACFMIFMVNVVNVLPRHMTYGDLGLFISADKKAPLHHSSCVNIRTQNKRTRRARIQRHISARKSSWTR